MKNLFKVGEKDPLLALWRYGNGKVAVFTSDSGYRCLSAWAGTEAYNLLFSQTIRSVKKGVLDKGLRIRSSTGHIIVDAFGEDRSFVLDCNLKAAHQRDMDRSFYFRRKLMGVTRQAFL